MKSSGIKIFGIKNCDTIKKTRAWLAEHAIEYEFHDYKKVGIEQETLRRWIAVVGWEMLVNRRGTTWRKLDEIVKADINESRAIDLMVEHTSMIKRPVIEHDGGLLVGFDEAAYVQAFKQ